MDLDKLVEATCIGDEKAFEELIQVTTLKLKGLLLSRYKLQISDLDEVIQLATIKAFNKISSFRRESSFTTWFYIVLKNEALNFIKKRNHIEQHELQCGNLLQNEDSSYEDFSLLDISSAEDSASSILEKKEMSKIYREMIEHVLEDMSDGHRQVILMSLEEDKSYKEIAKELGIPIGTVMSRLFFARQHAKQKIIPYARKHSIQLDCLGKRN